MDLSHHSSNPLEAHQSDSINQKYHHVLDQIQQGCSNYSQSSEDELGLWREEYQNHVKVVTGAIPTPVSNKRTPKAGPSRLVQPMVDLDTDMESDDELAIDETTLSPRKGSESTRGTMDSLQMRLFPEVGLHESEEMEGRPNSKVKIYPSALEIPPYRKKGNPPDEQDAMENVGRGEEENGQEYEELEVTGGEEVDEKYPIQDEDDEMPDDENADDSRSRSSSPLTPCSSSHSAPYSSPQSSRPSSPDESTTIANRPPDEQREIADEIDDLYESVPDVHDNYLLVDRLGTGTFSSVYKAVDLKFRESYNAPWLGHHPPESSAYYQSAGPGYKGRGGRALGWRKTSEGMDVDREDDETVPDRVYVAIKRIYTTSGPERIRNELAIMEACRSCRHTSQIITAFRNEDQVVIVLPYQRNSDFREFYQDLHPEGIKCYFRCLFRALRDIHARGIIHRDVKPANFLYNPFTGIGTLCDFGLASRMETGSHLGRCFHSLPTAADPHGKNVSLSEAQTNDIKRAQKEARAKSQMSAERVGYPEQDRRPVSKANRAGTRGFRAPEVLLKCGSQNGAIDVWSAGVILLFFLTGKFPIFQSNDDIEGLMEIAVIIGKKKIERAATLHGRTIATNIPDLDQDGISWQEFVEKLNPGIKEPRKYDMRYYPHNCKHRDGRGSMHPPVPPLSSSPTSLDGSDAAHGDPINVDPIQQPERYANPPSIERHAKEMKTAFHFLELILHFESTKRATPRKALYHKFLEEAGAPPDDDVVPHLMGEGVCGDHHFRDDDAHFARIQRLCRCRGKLDHSADDIDYPEYAVDLDSDSDDDDNGVRCEKVIEEYFNLSAGEGVAIGNQPCEFHKDMGLV